MRDLHHHRLDLPEVKTLNRPDIEVWDDDPEGKPPHVTLYFDFEASADLLPNEARALAALLISAADWQDRRSKK